MVNVLVALLTVTALASSVQASISGHPHRGAVHRRRAISPAEPRVPSKFTAPYHIKRQDAGTSVKQRRCKAKSTSSAITSSTSTTSTTSHAATTTSRAAAAGDGKTNVTTSEPKPEPKTTTTTHAEEAKHTSTSTTSSKQSEPTADSNNNDDSSSGSTGSSGMTAEQEAQFLTLHNDIRSKHNAVDLKWSSKLAGIAAGWAGKCDFKHSGGTLGPYGENLAAGTGSGYDVASAMKSWTDEISEYSSSNPVPSHYTQVVWRGTTEVGCGLASCDGIFDASYGKAKYFVCEYFPQGNIIGAFATNVE